MSRRDRLTAENVPIREASELQEFRGSRGFWALRTQRLAAFEREYLLGLLQRLHGDVAGAAREAQLPRGTIYRLLKKHGLNPKAFRGS